LSVPRAIRITESGGVTGIMIRRELETATLSEEDRAELDELWDAAQQRLFEPQPRPAKAYPDEKQYAITVVGHDGTMRTIEVKDPSAPPPVIDLVTWVQARSHPASAEPAE